MRFFAGSGLRLASGTNDRLTRVSRANLVRILPAAGR